MRLLDEVGEGFPLWLTLYYRCNLDEIQVVIAPIPILALVMTIKDSGHLHIHGRQDAVKRGACGTLFMRGRKRRVKKSSVAGRANAAGDE